MEKYVWEGSVSEKNLAEILSKILKTPIREKPEYLQLLQGDTVSVDNIRDMKPVEQYKNATTVLHNEGMDEFLLGVIFTNEWTNFCSGENGNIVEDYGKTVRNLFNLPIKIS